MLSRADQVNIKTSVLCLEMNNNHCSSLPVTNEVVYFSFVLLRFKVTILFLFCGLCFVLFVHFVGLVMTENVIFVFV